MYDRYSSVEGPGRFAVDGIEDGSILHTKLTDLDPNPWFEIDLMKIHFLYQIRVLGRHNQAHKMGYFKVDLLKEYS